jgi:hypothetical protein
VPLHEQACVDDSVQQWEDGSHANDSNGGKLYEHSGH